MHAEDSYRLHQIRQRLKALSPDDSSEITDDIGQLLERVAELCEACENSPAGYLHLDRSGRILGSNLTFCSMVDVRRAELINRSSFEFVIPKHHRRLSAHLWELFETGAPGHCELQLKSGDKSPLVRFHSIRRPGRSGGHTAHTSVFDVSDQKAAEDALERLAVIVETSEYAILLVDPDGMITEWNPAAERIYGYSRQEAVGRHKDILLPPDRKAELGRLIAMVRRGEKISGYNTVRRHRDGREMNIALTMSPITDEDGNLIAISTFEQDVTEEKRRERQVQEINEKLQMAVQAAELGVWNCDLAAGTAKWNDQLYRLLGLEPWEGPEKAERLFEFIHPQDRLGCIADLRAVRSLTDDHIKEEFRVIRADGKTRWLTTRGRIFRDERGQPIRISSINYDITERKQAEEMNRLAQIQLKAQLLETERINEELSQYAYAVSHDLKQPLRAIRNYTEFLYEDLAGTLLGDQKKYLEGLKGAVDLGAALIDDLLSFSRIGREPLEVESVDVPDLVNEIRSVLNPPSDVEISVQQDWPDLRVDRNLLRQILQNLIGNGIKFNERTPKRIEVGWQPTGDGRMDLFVRDNGIGIKAQYGDQIFRIFQRLHTQKHYEGTGIGLAIVQKAAQKLGGSVRLESEPGKGSTFYVRLLCEPVG